MKRLPIVRPHADSSRKTPADDQLWVQTAAELQGDPAVEEQRVREFSGSRPFEPPAGVDRRTFLSLMGASMGMAGLAGCRRAEEKILPFAHMPPDFVPGRSEYYATAMPMFGTAIGLLVESVDGRPIKVEGNPEHPESLGASSAFVQASVLDVYDPDRSKSPQHAGKAVSQDEAWKFIADLGRSLRASKGRGFAILMEDHRSPTTGNALLTLLRDMPEVRDRLYRFEPFGRENQRSGVAIAFGALSNKPDPSAEPTVTSVVSYDLEQADVVVVLDADILGMESSPIKNSKAFAKRRRAELGKMNRIYVAEPCPTVTGHGADHRLRIQARRIRDLLNGLAAALAAAGTRLTGGMAVAAPKLSDAEQKWVRAAANDLAKAAGNGLVVVGNRQPAALHALAAVLNDSLGSIGTTVSYARGGDISEGPAGLRELTDKIKSKEIETLLILGGNPAFSAPGDLAFEAALKTVKTSIHLSSHVDETSAACTWHIPRAHYLESWSDASSEDGVVCVVQPLIAPMYGGRTDAELLDKLVGGMRSPYELVMSTWGGLLASGASFDKDFQKVIHNGVHRLDDNGAGNDQPVIRSGDAAKLMLDLPAVPGDFEVVFAPDAHAYDGRYANNAWLIELPDPIHKGTWMSMAAISYATAQKLGVENGDPLEITVGTSTIKLPAVVSYGHADDSVTVSVGLGRRFAGRVCQGVGVDAAPIRASTGWGFAGGSVKKGGADRERLAITQGHFVMEGRPLVRTQTVAELAKSPSYARELVQHPPLVNLWGDWQYDGARWGMAIDLTLCTGCNACVTACQAENNIPVIGVEGVLKSREMHWIRIDRYFAGKGGQVEGLDEAPAAFMPMLCQHCENAPCEQVCPVNATTHSPEGINEMTYNRCIGTKYCGNNCPFKVRRFNYFNYTKDTPEEVKLVLNPDVTVRSRGVMEKCTFCVQRVNQAKITAKKLWKTPEQARLTMRRVKSACMDACPTEAITFGDLNDPSPREDERTPVAALAASGRAYNMLEEINVRPRISYLARIRNPNVELEPPKAASATDGHAEQKPGAKESH